jgi:membrane-associated phospholipid phosphatase
VWVKLKEPSAASDRHASDAVRAASALVALTITGWLARDPQSNLVELNAFRLINELPATFGPPLLGIMQLGALAAIPALAAVAAVRRRPGLTRRLLAGGTAAWAVARLLQVLVVQEPPDVVLGGVILHGSAKPGLAFPATHVAVAAAMATVAAPYLSRPNRRLAWIGVGAIGIARIYVGAHFPIDVVGGAAVGWGAGSLFHLIVGSPRRLPKPEAVRFILAEHGYPGGPLRPLGPRRPGVAVYMVVPPDPKVVKVVGRDQPEVAWLYRAWRLLAFREDAARRPPLTPQQLVEHEAYLLLLAERGGVNVPPVRAATTVGEDLALLARGCVEGISLGELPGPQIDDAVLLAVWQQLAALHSVGVDLGRLRLDSFVAGVDGRVWVVDVATGGTDGGADRFVHDHAELCVAVADRCGARRAARSAIAALDADGLRQLAKHLVPLKLSPASRKTGARDGLLEQVRAELAEAAGMAPPTVVSPVRVAALLAALVAVNLLLPQIAKVGVTIDALRQARWGWASAIVAASGVTYLAAAVSLMGAAGRRMPIGRRWRRNWRPLSPTGWRRRASGGWRPTPAISKRLAAAGPRRWPPSG